MHFTSIFLINEKCKTRDKIYIALKTEYAIFLNVYINVFHKKNK